MSGYKVYYQADSSTQPFQGSGATQGAAPIDVHNQTTATISGLDPAHAYNFAVTAYNTSGAESAYSNIVSVPELVSPTVSISNPAGNTTVSGTVAVTASASDNVGVTKVEFYVNGILQATDTSTPYLYSWNTTSFAVGTNTLMAKAYDAAGNVGQSANVTVSVVNDTTAPIVSVTAPGNNATVSGTITISASASDNVGVTQVAFYLDGTLLTATNITPYSYSWNTTTASNGTHTLSAKAYDTAGNAGSSSNVTVTVSNAYTVSASAGSGGAISPTGNSVVNYGGSQTFTITPATGYNVAGVTVDGSSVGAVTSYTFSNVTANHTIAATFAVNTNTVSASAGTGGAISPTGNSVVNYGGSQTFAITPATGYHVAGVTVDGSSVGAVTSYTFSNVTANHTIAATFAVNTNTVSASAGTGGAISPTGNSVVNYGGSQTFTITPATGYNVAGVTVDGSSVGAITSYTFSNVTANHTIAATFAVNTSDINIASLASVTASSQNTSTGQLASKAVDGSTDGNPAGNYTHEWATMGQLAGAWIQLKWSKTYVIDRIVLYDRPNLTDQVLGGILTFSDGTSITVGQLANDGTGNTFSFTPKTVRWVKFAITNAQGVNIGLSEFQVFGH